MAPQVTVFIDYQNAHLSAHENWCGFGEPEYECLIDPLKLAERLVAKRAPGGILADVHVYRGRPDPRKQPTMTRYNDRQRSAWSRDERVHVHTRALKYPRDFGKPDSFERPREKGIDVWLAVDLVRMAMRQEYEVGIVFSRDDDLVPAIELAVDLPGAHTEVGTWAGSSRIRLDRRKLYCHMLDEGDFRDVIDTRKYS